MTRLDRQREDREPRVERSPGALWTALSAALILLTTALTARGQDPGVRPTAQVLNCTIAGCHTDVTSYTFLHGPVASGACTTCHMYNDAAQHTFVDRREGADQCAFCHIGKTANGGINTHEPVEKGLCLDCHNPHGSETKRLIRAPSIAQNCFSCHDEMHETLGEIEHTAFKEGDCLGCHSAHASMQPNLLVAEGRDLCLTCHDTLHGHAPDTPKPYLGTDLTFGLLENVRMTWWEHRPEAFDHHAGVDDCLECHTSHASDQNALLVKPLASLCASCHEDVVNLSTNAWVKHPGVTEEQGCMNCHAPHDSDQRGLLRDTVVNVCAACHNDPENRLDAPRAPWMTQASVPGEGTHAHAGQDCIQCHDVHGGKFTSLLVRPYTSAFYLPYSRASYALCLGCHDRSMIEETTTKSATGFRNGDTNLHSVHVIGEDGKGRSCSACHTPHISESAELVRPKVPFGQWAVPIGFVQTKTGGSCNAGCHRSGRYDRVNPVPPEELQIIAIPEGAPDAGGKEGGE
jgi:predicted CXXCH cytochrome family protein